MVVSFIIPVYNSSKTIHRCVDSILALDSSEYEIILVDDGSIDSSSYICDEYAKEYELDLPEKELKVKAEAFAIRNNGRSPRTAKQFVEFEKINQTIVDEE